MGRGSRRKHHYPKLLGKKLLHIRKALGLSQNGMIKRLGSPEGLLGTSISGYERGIREPPLLIILQYARIAGICVDALLEDEVELPIDLPSIPKHSEFKRQPASLKSKRMN
jgi:transcriptional regulator with XRE-family HTH domain